MKTLRARLLLTLLPTTMLVWMAASVLSYFKASHEAVELLDGQLAQSSKLIMAQVLHERGDASRDLGGEEAAIGGELHPYEQPLAFQVWGPDGQLWLRSGNAPSMPRGQAEGYQRITQAGEPWRMLTVREPGGHFLVQVAQPLADREQVALEVATRVGLPLVIAFPLVVLLVYGAVSGAMRPLDRMAMGVAARSPDNLENLSENGGTPLEVKPLVRAINHLLGRLRTALDNERRFTADAAHELRTPLAAIKIQTQVALASGDEAERRHALRQVQAGTDRATRLVEQLLRLARLDPLSGLATTTEVRLDVLGERLTESLAAQARAAGKVFQRTPADGVATVPGDEDLLQAALRNLLENALRHTPQGGVVTWGVEIQEGRPRLWVLDGGAGVPEEDLRRLGERFYRGSGAVGEGSGLGLAIVRRVAELHGARLVLANHPPGGLLASLDWDAPPPRATG
ncbi:MAG TPA: sensor histidine kinase N-terminal domain-containing protein [Thiobacillaceae bacterium]|nr:sensor histidine kinase N-terminal domain-containing protein [Thiobacillaceae bacterium]HNH87919.1 sensor histidine kinase N-terminal domain-containing protein [Thiobacillaceae bacterium]